MRKRLLKGLVSILFVGMFLVPVISNSVLVQGGTISPTGMDPGTSMD
ncbi:hypothetical protein [Clostridium sp. C8-1-8]|nr:hypothetical protein [Clostridium sp. C8-1-8]